MAKRRNDGIAFATRMVAGSGVVLVVLALLAFGFRSAFGTAIGAALATSNLWMLGKIIEALLPPGDDADGDVDDDAPPPSRSRGSSALLWSFLAGLKILVLFGGAWMLMTKGWASPMALCAGYGALPIGITLSTLRASMRTRRRL